MTKGWVWVLRRVLNIGANTRPCNERVIARKPTEMKSKNGHLSTLSPTVLLEVF